MTSVTGTTGNDLLQGTDDDDALHGLGGNDSLIGLAGADLLFGDSGNDFLNGGSGVDTLAGGGGDDTYVIERGAPVNPQTWLGVFGEPGAFVMEGPHLFSDADGTFAVFADDGTLDGLADTMMILFAGPSAALSLVIRTYALGSNFEPGFYDEARRLESGHAGLDFTANGSGSNEVFGNFTIHDMAFDYTSGVPQAVSVWIDFEQHSESPAAPALFGTFRYNYSDELEADTIVELENGGIDTVHSAMSYTLGAHLENLVLTGTATRGTGNALDNVITGNAFGNTLDGAEGADSMFGGAGNDTYLVHDVGDLVVERRDKGIDTVLTSISYTLGKHVENLTLTGTAALNGVGNGLDNVLTGNSAVNVLAGGAGNDTLDGRAGADAMSGGSGDDTYFVDEAGDAVTEAAKRGTDTVRSAIDYTLGANVENLALTGFAMRGTGNDRDNVITGNDGFNTLVGAAGNDVIDGGFGLDLMVGGRGNDVFIVDDSNDFVHELPGEGYDTVKSSASYVLWPEIEVLVLTGSAAISGVGNDQANKIVGNEAANVLDGQGGADTLRGGAGNDTYFVDASDVVVEKPGDGTDTVNGAFTYTLGRNVENLNLAGADTIDGTGNALNNVLVGNSAANTLRGGMGSDHLTGGAGADTFDYDAIGEGQDTVADFVHGAGGDVLDVSDVLVGYAAGTSHIADFVRLTKNGQHTNVDVNVDGKGSDFVTLAILENVSATAGLLNELVAQGNLVLA